MIPLSKPDISTAEIEYANEAVLSTQLSGFGPFIDQFEEKFANEVGTTYSLVSSSGTTALHLALLALGVGPGDEVLVPAQTYVATANAVAYVGATPIFVDVDPSNWCLSVATIQDHRTSRTVGIISVDLYGFLPDYSELRDFADAHGLWIVEDAAQATFASRHGVRAGSFGDISCFSFFGNKILTCGEGGAVTTNDADLYGRMRQFRGQGVDSTRRYWFPVIGYNYRLSNVSAAILCAQLERKDEILYRRREVFSWYFEALAGHPRIETRVPDLGVVTAPWLFTTLLRPRSGASRDTIATWMHEQGVETRPTFVSLDSLPPYASPRLLKPAVSHDISDRGLSLPTFAELSRQEVEFIARCLVDALDT